MTPDRAGASQFIQGFVIAMTTFNRLHDRPTACAEVLRTAGITLAGARKAGVEQYDLAELRKIMAAAPSPAIAREAS